MKDIENFEGLYAVTPKGEVWSYRSKRFLKPYADTSGYLMVQLCKNGQKKTCRIHRLVAEAYLPNPEGLPQVDHIDNIKTHNYLQNLQWITNRDNSRKANNKPILQYDLEGNFIKEWQSAADVGKKASKAINNCLKGRTKTAYNYIWKYKNEEDK